MSNKQIMKAFVSVMIFLIMFMSYGTLRDELTTLAGHANSTAIERVLSQTFPLWWWFTAVMFLGLAVYFGSKA